MATQLTIRTSASLYSDERLSLGLVGRLDPPLWSVQRFGESATRTLGSGARRSGRERWPWPSTDPVSSRHRQTNTIGSNWNAPPDRSSPVQNNWLKTVVPLA